MVAFKIYAIIKRIYWFNGLPWTFTRSSHCEVFPEINLNQKRFNLYTSWVLWENQCILTIRKHALLWNKHEYQHSVDMLKTFWIYEQFVFDFVLDVLIVVYTPRIVWLTFTNQYMHVILLTMLLFTMLTLFWYKERVVSLVIYILIYTRE